MRSPTSALRRGAAATARALGAGEQWRRLLHAVDGARDSAEGSRGEVQDLRAAVSALRARVDVLGDELATSRELQSDLLRAAEEHLGLGRAAVDQGAQLLQRVDDLDRLVATRVATHQLAPALVRAVRAVDVGTWSLLALRDLLPAATRLPPPGGAAGWAATPETVLLLVREVLHRSEHPAVVECGSGASTVWLAAALAERGGGHLVALEHSDEYAERTRAQLRSAALERFATVLAAPLAPAGLVAHGTPWYDGELLRHLPDVVDVLFVDGPPGSTGPAARLPALPRLGDRLTAGAAVVLDDTDRPEEREVLSAWVDGADGRLVVERRTDRATLLRWRGGDAAAADDDA